MKWIAMLVVVDVAYIQLYLVHAWQALIQM